MKEQFVVLLGIDSITDEKLDKCLMEKQKKVLTDFDVTDDVSGFTYLNGCEEEYINSYVLLTDSEGLVGIGYLLGYSEVSGEFQEYQLKLRELNVIGEQLKAKLSQEFNTVKSPRLLMKSISI